MQSLDVEAWWQWMEMLEILAYRTVAVLHCTDQNWIPITVYCIRCVIVCKIGFTNWNAKIAPLRESMVVIYYIKLFRTGADRHNGILISTPASRRDNKYTIASMQITNTEMFSFITFLVFKLLSSKVLFLNRTDNRNCWKVGYFFRK